MCRSKFLSSSLWLAALAGCAGAGIDEEALQRFHRAEALFARERWGAAIDDYEFVIRWRPMIREAYFHLATCYEKLGNERAAIATLERELRNVYNKDEECLRRLARLYELNGRYGPAADCLEKVLALHPGDATIITELSRVKGLADREGR